MPIWRIPPTAPPYQPQPRLRPLALESGVALQVAWLQVSVPAADTNVTLTPSPAVVTLSAVQPTIALAKALAPDPAVVTLSQPTQLLDLGGVTSLAPNPAVVTLTAVAPTIAHALTLLPTPAMVTLTAVAVTVVAPSPTVLTPDPAVVTLVAVTIAVGERYRYPLELATGKHYLVDQDGTPYLLIGNTMWSLATNALQADVTTYLDDRFAKGYSGVMFNVIDKFQSGAPNNEYSEAPFTGANFTTPNEDYFAQVDWVVQACADRNINVFLAPLYLGWSCENQQGWCQQVQAASIADMESYGTYIGERYAAYDNIVYMIGGDNDPADNGIEAKVDAFADALLAADPNHLMTAHMTEGTRAREYWTTASWLNVDAIWKHYASTPRQYEDALDAYGESTIMPVFLIEGSFENEHSMTGQNLRAQMYWVVFSGGFGNTFGNCPLWGMGPGATSILFCGSSDWEGELNSDGSIGMQRAGELLYDRRWYDLVPDSSHTLLTAGYGTFGGTSYATAGKTADGALAMAYIPSNRAVTVNLAQMVAGETTAYWFDPTSGDLTTIGTYSNTGSQTWTPSATNDGGDADWVLLLEAVIILTPTPAVVSLTAVTATIGRALALTPSPAVVPITAVTPTVVLATTLTPTPVAITLQTVAVSIAHVKTLAPNPAVVTINAVGFVLDLGGVKILAPDPAVVTLVAVAVTPGGALALVPTPVAVTLNAVAPTITRVYTLAPNPATVTVAAPSVALTHAKTLALGAVAVTLTAVPVSISGVDILGPGTVRGGSSLHGRMAAGAQRHSGLHGGSTQRP